MKHIQHGYKFGILLRYIRAPRILWHLHGALVHDTRRSLPASPIAPNAPEQKIDSTQSVIPPRQIQLTLLRTLLLLLHEMSYQILHQPILLRHVPLKPDHFH